MKTSPHAQVPAAAAPGLFTGFTAGWSQFWFAPADPTKLGFIRVCAGLLTLYVHLVYCFDLQELFGKHAWLDHDTMDHIRHEGPTMVPRDDFLDLTADRKDWENDDLGRYLFSTEFTEEQRRRKLDALVEVLEVDPAKLPAPGTAERYAELGRQYFEFFATYKVDPRQLKSESPERRAYIKEYASHYGIHPDYAYSKGKVAWSMWFHITDPGWMWVVHSAALVVMLLFTIGYYTRITSVLTWLAAVSYVQRSDPTNFGQDSMMNIVLLYLMIGPSGAALSVDRWLERRRARRLAAEGGEPAVLVAERPAPSVGANFAIRLMQVHFCFIYLASGFSKLQGATWWAGTSIWWTMANYSFAPLNNTMYRDLLSYLTNHRWMLEAATTLGVLHTFIVEIGFPFLVWARPARWIMLIMAVLLHMGIALIMGLTIFQLYMLTLLLAFFPAEVIERLSALLTVGWQKLLLGESAKLEQPALSRT